MPLYEYACSHCRTVFQFWTQRINETKTPSCPKCGNQKMQKMISAFAIGKKSSGGDKATTAQDDVSLPDPFANMTPDQQARAEHEMMRLMGEAESIDENDPRQMGALLRKISETSGMDMGQEMNEAIRRLESGEDPEKIEEEMGDMFGDMPDGMPGYAGKSGWNYDSGLYDL